MKTATQQAEEEVKKDRVVLLRYADSRPVTGGDMPVLRKHESMGLVHIGFSFGKKESLASLTDSGKKLLGLAG